MKNAHLFYANFIFKLIFELHDLCFCTFSKNRIAWHLRVNNNSMNAFSRMLWTIIHNTSKLIVKYKCQIYKSIKFFFKKFNNVTCEQNKIKTKFERKIEDGKICETKISGIQKEKKS